MYGLCGYFIIPVAHFSFVVTLKQQFIFNLAGV